MSDTMRPYDVTCQDDFLHMKSDNTHFMDRLEFSLVHNGTHVSIHFPAQEDGSCGWIEIPVEQFNKIVDWYMAPQPLKQRKSAA